MDGGDIQAEARVAGTPVTCTGRPRRPQPPSCRCAPHVFRFRSSRAEAVEGLGRSLGVVGGGSGRRGRPAAAGAGGRQHRAGWVRLLCRAEVEISLPPWPTYSPTPSSSQLRPVPQVILLLLWLNYWCYASQSIIS
ncbi:hypothetical protein PVAP13_5NG010132 [Panicum virgatum]|uniref:Uncharacterized protein n=1 Tax=Panicum virgatum TaxID=38727 RepID=A0A8T0S7A5_PANVG|nr:hypothetical protein PVAP13_5NG010132 [Panicum virgatum]